MTGLELDALIFKAQSGSILTVQELAGIVDELVMYRALALRMERVSFALAKKVERYEPV